MDNGTLTPVYYLADAFRYAIHDCGEHEKYHTGGSL